MDDAQQLVYQAIESCRAIRAVIWFLWPLVLILGTVAVYFALRNWIREPMYQASVRRNADLSKQLIEEKARVGQMQTQIAEDVEKLKQDYRALDALHDKAVATAKRYRNERNQSDEKLVNTTRDLEYLQSLIVHYEV